MLACVGYLKRVADQLEAAANAKRDGKLVVLHGTQMFEDSI
jgi:hypothetical protein